MLDEQQLPVRSEHACDLAKRALGLVDGAEDERRDDGVHGRVGQRQALGRRVDDLGDARMPLHATCKSPAHRRFGLGEHELGEPVGIVRDIEPCAGADLDDVADGAVQKRASAAAHAGELTQPEKRVVHEREDPQPRRGRPARLELGACCLRHPANVRAAAPCRHRSTRPSPADGRFRLCHRSPRRAASATAAVRERRPSLRRMFATCR